MFRRKPRELPPSPEWVIVGLGNPGPEYRGTRHNVGFEVVERLAAANRIELRRGRNRALTGAGTIDGVQVLLVKPLTFMNLSGQAVGPISRAYGMKPEQVLVVADDLDLVLGKVKLKLKGSAGGHNGHKSIIAGLRSQEYPRFKVGIGDAERHEVLEHVLSGFEPYEREVVDGAIDACVEAIQILLTKGSGLALNRLADHNRLIKGVDSPESEQ